MKNVKVLILVLMVGLFSLNLSSKLMAHCEIPCGIYGDSTRFVLLEEHIVTMEKSINKILLISAAKPLDHNQLHRWIKNKEEHAEKFGHIITQYFMRQRIKIAKESGKLGNYDPDYVQKLVLLHELYVHSMKVKQTTDLRCIQTLRMILKRFKILYNNH